MRISNGKRRIFDAYIALIKEHGSDDFPLKLLISRAKTHHSTFYYHFHGIDDVIDQIMDEYLDAFRQSFQSLYAEGEAIKPDRSAAAIVSSIRFVHAHRDAFSVLLNSKYRPEFKQRLINCVQDALRCFDYTYFSADGKVMELSPREVEYKIGVVSYDIMCYLEIWCEGGFIETPDELVATMVRLLGTSNTIGEMRASSLYQIS